MWRPFKTLIGADSNPAPVIATTAATSAPFATGPSSLVAPVPPKKDGEELSPFVGMLLPSQVAERWLAQILGEETPESITTALNAATQGMLWDQNQLFERMEEKCPELRGAIHKYKVKCARRIPRISPPDFVSNPDVAKQKAEQCSVIWAGIEDWPRAAYNLLDGVGKGISGAEIDWQIGSVLGKRAVVINDLKWVPHQHWGYWYDSPELQLFPDLFNRAHHIPVPPRKFIVYQHLTKSGHPSRSGLHRAIVFHFLLYSYALKDWATISECFGTDVAWAFSREGTKEEQFKILAWLKRLAARCGVFKAGTEIHIEKAGGTGNHQKELVQYCVEQMIILVLGSSLGTQAGTHGARSLGLVQQDETEELVDWGALLLASTVRKTAIRWLCEFNFAEPGDIPMFELPGANRRDLAALANVITALADCGLQIGAHWAGTQFDIPQPKPDEPVLHASSKGNGAANDVTANALTGKSGADEGIIGYSTLTEHQAQAALDQIRASAIQQGRDTGAFDQIEKPIKAIIVGKGSPAEKMAALHKVASEIAPTELQGVAKQMFIFADLVARGAVGNGNGGKA